MRGLPGKVIGMHANITTMEQGSADTLQRALEQALVSSTATAEVQPGESYYDAGSPTSPGGPTVAHQPIRATLSFEWDPNGAGYPEPCILAVDQIPCRFPGQDCGLFCTVDTTVAGPTWRLSPLIGAAGIEWDAAIVVHADWRYISPNGQLLATSAESFGLQLLTLRIIWDDTSWLVTPVFGHVPGFDVADDPVCDPARYWLSQSTWSFMLGENPPPGSQAQFASDTNPADGCVAALNQVPGDSSHLAIFLERFGLLLTVNDNARNPTDNLPVADAAEQATANRLMAQLSPP
jgi:hypothetical protein